MTAIASGRPDSQFAKRKRYIIHDNQKVRRRSSELPESILNGKPRVVHERQRFDQDCLCVTIFITEIEEVSFSRFVLRPPSPSQLIQDTETDIVSRVLISRPRIAEADNYRLAHAGTTESLLLLFLFSFFSFTLLSLLSLS